MQTISFTAIVDLWPSCPKLAADINAWGAGLAPGDAFRPVTDGHVRSWKARNSIPDDYWLALVERAPDRDIEGLSLAVLANLAARGGEIKMSHAPRVRRSGDGVDGKDNDNFPEVA